MMNFSSTDIYSHQIKTKLPVPPLQHFVIVCEVLHKILFLNYRTLPFFPLLVSPTSPRIPQCNVLWSNFVASHRNLIGANFKSGLESCNHVTKVTLKYDMNVIAIDTSITFIKKKSHNSNLTRKPRKGKEGRKPKPMSHRYCYRSMASCCHS